MLFRSPVATAEFSEFAGILSATLSQHHFSGFEIAQLEFHHLHYTKATFHAKMGTIKDRNCIDLTEAENIKKKCQEYTEELYKKDLHDPDKHDTVITHLEPDILQFKWA